MCIKMSIEKCPKCSEFSVITVPLGSMRMEGCIFMNNQTQKTCHDVKCGWKDVIVITKKKISD